LLKRLDASPDGLSDSQAAERLERYGRNSPGRAEHSRPLIEFLRFCTNPLVLILFGAGVISTAIGQVADGAIITAMIVLSVILNFLQSYRSQKAVGELRRQVAATAAVRRSGNWTEIPASEIVPGDVIRLSAGDLVPADARLLTSVHLHVQQAALTGESMPADKEVIEGPAAMTPDCEGVVFLGTSVVSGTATALVHATGRLTAFGDIALRLASRAPETEFDRGTRKFGILIMKTVFLLVLFVLTVNVSMHRNVLESLLFAVALAVGLTPEFLPMITTVTLSAGAVRMARKKVIVKHLAAIENFGSIDILCSDKTGTVTTGRMTLDRSLDPFGNASELPLLLGFLNSSFETGIRSPLDQAILDHNRGLSTGEWHKTGEVPFDFERRRLSISVQRNSERMMITKGAPESVLEVCASIESLGSTRVLDDQSRQCSRRTFEALSAEGLRVLAVAYRTDHTDGLDPQDERDLTLVGFLGFVDPPVANAAESIEALRRDGVAIKVLTGDNEVVTRYVCSKVGIDSAKIVLGSEIDRMGDAALGHVAEGCDVFARVSPGQKNRIIRALKARSHVVGFMGDGINDAPSLHAADVGISVSGAVDVARDAAEIILLEENLGVLHNGIIEGRKAFGNVFKYILMGTSSNFGNMFSMAGAVLFLPFLPMLPTQVLLNNFLYDLAQITIPTDRVDGTYIQKPQHWNIGLIRNFMLIIGPLSSIYDFLTFGILLLGLHASEAAFHTGWFIESLATQTLVLFVIRTADRPWRSRPSAALAIATIAIVAAGIALPYTPVANALGFVPLPPAYYIFLVAATLSYLALVEVMKGRIMGRPAAHGTREQPFQTI
jgi:Mg2+-importing ATPase